MNYRAHYQLILLKKFPQSLAARVYGRLQFYRNLVPVVDQRIGVNRANLKTIGCLVLMLHRLQVPQG
jgi:hypothetical protein